MTYTTNPISVRYVETDKMQFVHHSNYAKYFELARLEWLAELGVSYASIEKEGILLPVISIKTEFKKPLYFGDEFRITVSSKKNPQATLELDYHVVNQNNQKICEGNTILAFLSAKKNIPIRCPKFLLKLFT